MAQLAIGLWAGLVVGFLVGLFTFKLLLDLSVKLQEEIGK